MAGEYVEVIAKIKASGIGGYALMDTSDIETEDGRRLDAVLAEIPIIVPLTQSEYNALEESGTLEDDVIYMVSRDDGS